MKILLLLGTSRKNGNSAKVVEYIKQHCRKKDQVEIDDVYLIDKKIKPCVSCYKCNENAHCMIEDDVSEIVERMIQSDAIVYMPVVHAFSSNTIFQAFLERSGFGFLRPKGRPLRNKLANAIAIGRRYAHTSVIAQLFMNIYLNEMIIVGSGFPMTIFSYGEFPGDAMLDSEGKDSISQGLTRMIDFYHNNLKRKPSYDHNDAEFILAI